MDTNRLQELAGKQACEAKTKILSGVVPDHIHHCQQLARCNSSQLKLGGFDDDRDWSDDPSTNDSASAISVAGAELRRTSVAQATVMEVVSPLVRSIFEGRKKLILDASQKAISKKDLAGGGAQFLAKQVPQKDRGHAGEEFEKTTLNKKVQALDEEIAIFKKESKRVKNLAKEHEEGLTRLAREKAEWEQQKKSQMQAFQAQQEEQIEKLKKEKQILDHRSVTLNILPAVQRKDVEELKGTLAKEQEEHRGKEMRLRRTINRLRAMNEDLTKQVLEMQNEIRRYEGCVLSALDGRGNGLQATSFSKKPCGEAKHKHSCIPPKQPPLEALRGGSSKSSRHCPTEESCDDLASLSSDEAKHCRTESTPKFFSQQAKFLSDLFSQPWKLADCAVQEHTLRASFHARQTGRLARKMFLKEALRQ